jgi:hypothetical protein
MIQIRVIALASSITLLTAGLFYSAKVSETKYRGYSLARYILPKVIGWHREHKLAIANFIKFFLAKNILHA